MQREAFIVGTARVGSNLLLEYLNQFSGVTIYGEIFKTDIWRDSWAMELAQSRPDLRALHSSNLVRFWSELRGVTPDSRVVGAKVFYYHADENTWNYIYTNGAILHLIRRDCFATYVSLRLAEHTGEWTAAGKARTHKPSSTISIGRSEFLAFRDRTQRYIEEVRLRSDPARYLELEYDSLLHPTILAPVLSSFLGAPPAFLRQKLIKQEHRHLSEVVTNYCDFEDILAKGDHIVG